MNSFTRKKPGDETPTGEIHTGRIVEWIDAKGYGFVATKSRRYFIHVRDFEHHHKRPEVGDSVKFSLGTDVKGRPCATKAIHVNDGGQISGGSLALLSVLLILPVLALIRLKLDWRWVAGYTVAVNLIAYSTYVADKNRAWKKLWRIPESQLHFVALIGGWPAAFLAQRNYRHKCSKFGFQMIFWFTVMLFQAVGYDCLNEWRYATSGFGDLKYLIRLLKG